MKMQEHVGRHPAKRLKPSPQSAPSPAGAEAPTDSSRLDKLERIEKRLRGRNWFLVSKTGEIQVARNKKEARGEPCWRSLRPAIDAAPEPPEAA